ncbi:MAG TPA: lysyl oxidase family protein [Actinomycetes bacterium]|nr:lysyl oxidase family protein [Actinomycetes bacterium]
MRTSRRSFVAIVSTAAAITIPLLAATVPASAGSSGTSTLPSVRLIGTQDQMTVVQTRRNGLYVSPSAYVASAGGAFELWAQRASYSEPLVVSQVVRQRDGDVKLIQPLPDITVTDLRHGLPEFLRITFTNSKGEAIRDRKYDFCPNDYRGQRVNDNGPENQTYPEMCYTNPFTVGMIWGIDRGWATQVRRYLHIHHLLPEGSYQLRVSLTKFYRDQFQVAPEDAAFTTNVDVVTKSSTTRTAKIGRSDLRRSGQSSLTEARSTVPGPDALPDIAALPAWGINVDNHRKSGRSYIRFGATVWNRGPSPLVVEGFREDNTEIMKAFQYFYRDGDLVGKARAGTMEYDHADGHEHWHFRDFANYSLLNAEKTQVVRSTKEAFCLAPTDIIDLTVAGASMRPWLEGLGTACGELDSLWIREVLQTGWGDTYAQYRPGQSFDVTDLPNGKYFVEVRANPDGRLYEVTDANNVALRKIFIRGPAGDRRVVVPPYQGIDTESGDNCSFLC